tara:strand:- start:5457 stop:6215 length:759 start_codon:yes stop_codon:yes gene_type:complete
MKILLSPAKSLDFKSNLPTESYSKPCFLDEANLINSVLRVKKPAEISQLMHISTTLSELNYERFQQWSSAPNKENSRQAIYAFSGDVYKGIDSYSIKNDKIDFMQNNVRILSGQYGLLKPLDLIQPHRLEMGTKISFKNYKNLYEYWKKHVSSQLNKELSKDEPVVNLASNEYFKVIDSKVIDSPIYSVNFKQYRDDNYKTIAIYSKKARGLMTRFIVDNHIKSINDLKSFNYDGYVFHKELSNDKDFIFTR